MLQKKIILILIWGCMFSSLFAFEELIRWKKIEFEDLPSNFPFVQKNIVPQGFAVHKDRIFIAIPRRNFGVPSTINYVKLNGKQTYDDPKVHSYPNYEMNELDPSNAPNSNRIVSVYRPRVDECNRLWFVDSGNINTSGNLTIIQRPSIWTFDLNTDTIFNRYEIPEHVVRDGLGLASITVDVLDCNGNTFAYIPDLFYSQLLIYNLQENKSYRMQHNYFRMNPFEGDFDVDKLQFNWDDGIFSITLGKRDNESYDRTAYFHPMCSFSEFIISTRVLRNETLATRSYHGTDVKLIGNRGRKSQSTMHSMHQKSGIIYFAEINKNAISCWNSNKILKPSNVKQIAQDDIKLIYPSDLSVVDDDLYVLSNRMIRHIYSTIDETDFNFRIFRQSVMDIKQCEDDNKQSVPRSRSLRRKFKN